MGILTTLFAAGAVGGASASLPKTDGSVSPGISPVDLDYNLIPMLVKKEDGKLIFSDCPEYADNYGILYEGTVEKGKGRVYYYHVNETGKPARVLVYAKSDKKQDITVTRTVKGDPSADYMPTGATLSFREAVNEAGDPVLVKLLPKERTVLFEDDKKGIRSGDLVSGIVEIETKKPVSLGVAIVPDGTKEDVKKALDLSVPLLPDSHEMRSTFPMDVYMENKPWDFSKGNAAISIGNSLPFQMGRDELSKVDRENTGDYGITYHMVFHSRGAGRYKLYINAQGGVYLGTFQISYYPNLPRVYRTDGQRSFRMFGNGTERDYIEAGTWDMGRDLFIRFIPAGAAFLPIRFLMVPEPALSADTVKES